MDNGDATTLVENLIRRAQRRFVFNEALGQTAFAGVFLLAGLALVLILGTRFLEWWTLGLFAAAGVAAGAVRLYRATPDVYTTAVRVDRNAQLNDVLSTAIYFHTHDAPYSNFQGAQREQAEAATRSVDLDAAVPFTAPRSLYAVAALALLASALVGVRFFGTHGLDLRPPLTEVLFEDQAAKLIGRKAPGGDQGAQERLKTAESLLAKLGLQGNPDGQQPDELDKAIEQALDNPGAPAKRTRRGRRRVILKRERTARPTRNRGAILWTASRARTASRTIRERPARARMRATREPRRTARALTVPA